MRVAWLIIPVALGILVWLCVPSTNAPAPDLTDGEDAGRHAATGRPDLATRDNAGPPAGPVRVLKKSKTPVRTPRRVRGVIKVTRVQT